MAYPAAFVLRVAKALIDDVAQQTEPVLNAAKRLENRESFLDSLKGAMQAGALLGELKSGLNHAIQLAQNAAKSGNEKEKELASAIIASAYFQMAVIEMGQGNLKAAISNFEKANEHRLTQGALYNMALAYLQMKGWFRDNTPQAVKLFKQCVDLDPHTDIAVAAGKELARLGAL